MGPRRDKLLVVVFPNSCVVNHQRFNLAGDWKNVPNEVEVTCRTKCKVTSRFPRFFFIVKVRGDKFHKMYGKISQTPK